METWLNHHHTQSEDASMMLGLEGHHGMSLGFGKVLEVLADPPDGWKLELSTNNPSAVDRILSQMVSEHCPRCNVNESTKPVWLKKVTITKCRFFYGGDLPSIAHLLGLSGHSGRHFCNLCTAPQSSLEWKEDEVHALESPSSKLKPVKPWPPRTLRGTDKQHRHFYTDGDNKKEDVKHYDNCLHPPLVHTEIDNHIVPSPLHIMMGIAQRLLEKGEEHCDRWKKRDVLEGIILNDHSVQRSQAHGGQLTGDAACRFFNIPIDMWRVISPRSKGDEERTVNVLH